MTLNPRLSLLATALSALAFLCATPIASAAPKKQEKAVGSLTVANNGTVNVNGRTEQSGAVLRCGDTVTTSESVTANMVTGPSYVIDPGSKVRIVCGPRNVVQFLVTYGGIHPLDGTGDDFEQLPYNPALGVGNGTFPSIGGGSASSGGKIPIFNSQGVVIGYAVTDSNGKVIAFTSTNGGVLAIPGPNGTPVSSVFGQGATGANLL